MTSVRKGQAPPFPVAREAFHERFMQVFFSPMNGGPRATSSSPPSRAWSQPATPSRVLLVCGSSRNDGTCPGEMSKTFRLVQLAQEVLQAEGMAEDVRRALCDWLDWMGLIDAGAQARLDRYIGYYQPYALSHDALDADEAVQEEVRNVARSVVAAVRELRAGRLTGGRRLQEPRQKWPGSSRTSRRSAAAGSSRPGWAA